MEVSGVGKWAEQIGKTAAAGSWLSLQLGQLVRADWSHMGHATSVSQTQEKELSAVSVVPLPDTDRRVARERQQQQQQKKLSVLGVYDTPMKVVVRGPAGQPLTFSWTERRMCPPPQSTGGMGRNSLRS